MASIVAHRLEPHHALRHFTAIIGASDWAPEQLKHALRDGQFFALGPENLLPRYLVDFDAGGILPALQGRRIGDYFLVPVANSDAHFADLTVKMASAIPGSKIFFREPYLKLTDNTTSIDGLQQIDSALYSHLEHRDINNSAVVESINARAASWMSAVMILTEPFEETPSFSILMDHAEMIAVDAYDGEGYLYWTRHGRPD